MSKYDKIHRPKYNYDSRKLADLFSSINNMNSDELTRFNLIYKIPLTVSDNDGNNLIHYVLKNNDPTKTEFHRLNIIKFLFNQNVNPDSPNNENMTPLHFACMKQYDEIIKYLIDDIGVNYNYQDNMGNTALHYLLAGIVKENKDDNIKSLVPLQEKKDTGKEKLWLALRKDIWSKIKDSEYLKAIKETIKNSISDSKQALQIAIEFEEELVKENLDPTSRNDLDRIKLFVGAYINKFRKIIDADWNSFPTIRDNVIHQKQITSYPGLDTNEIKGDKIPNKQAIIKNANINLRIKNDIETEKENLLDQLEKIDDIDMNDINFKDDIIQMKNNIVGVGNHLRIGNINRNYEKYRDTWKDTVSNFVIDEVDNIIDLNNKTFIGGARQFEIIDGTDHIDNTNDSIEDLVAKILSGNKYNNNLVNTGDIISVKLSYYFINFILSNVSDSTVTTTHFINYEKSLLNNYSSLNGKNVNEQYELIKNLINKRSKYTKKDEQKKYIYTLFCKFKLANEPSHLIGQITRWEMYLFAGFFNYQTDLKLSISQAARIEIIKNSSKKENMGTWVDRLLTDNFLIDKEKHSGNPNIEHIKIIVDEFITNKTLKRINYNLTQKLSKIDKDYFDKYTPCEIIVACIVNYYNSMPQKPLLQHLVDTISLLRYHMINDLDDTKLQSLYTDNLDPSNVNGLILNQFNNIRESKLDKTILDNSKIKIKNEYKNIFGDNMDSNLIEQLTEFQLPSMINFYISHNNLTEPEEKKHNILKMIEARLLGFNFVGTIPTSQFIERDGPNNIHINFFNFTNELNTGRSPNPNLNKYYNIKTIPSNISTIYLFKPPTNKNICNLLIESSNKLIELFNITARIISNYMDNFEATRKSKTYGKLITYLMPILNAITAQINTYKSLLETLDCNKRINIKYTKSFKSIVNKINGLLFLFYYINQDDIKIPAFISDQFNEYSTIEVFYNENSDIVFPNDDNLRLDVVNGTKINHKFGNIPIQGYNSIIREIVFGDYFLVSEIIKDNYDKSKSEPLPPSLKIVLSEFYEYNTINLIKDTLNNKDFTIDDLLPKNVSEQVKNITKFSMISKIIEELVKRKLKNYIHEIGISIFNEIRRGKNININETELEQMFDPVPFDVELNKELSDGEKEYIAGISDKKDKDKVKNFYKFYEDPVIKNKNFLYPDNYNRLNQINLLYYIDIKESIIDTLGGVNIYLNNNENENAIFNLLKFKNHHILQKLKDTYELNYERQFKINNGETLIQYIDNQVDNHVSLFTNNMNDQYDQIKYFVNTQYEDIKYIILSNDAFGNNIPKFLELSYSICNYITQQYLYEKINNTTDTYYTKFSNKKQIDFIHIDASGIDISKIFKYSPQTMDDSNIINRYNQLNYSPYTYLYGWSQVLPNIIDSSENIIQNNLDKIDIMKNVKDLSENYFIKGKYNEINLFTRDLLIHLTQKVICSTIEIIIRKVLLAQLQDQEKYKNKVIMIDYMFNTEDASGESLIDILNDSIAIELVQSNVGMFKSKKDKLAYTVKDTDDILYSFIDSMETLSPIELSDYTIKVLKNNIVKYLGTIIPKIIQNWKITSENVYLFSINQYNLLECKKIICKETKT